MTPPEPHRGLDAALARNSGPSAEDVETRPIAEEFAVVVAALLAGRIDGQEAVASLAAIHTRLLTAHTAAAKREGARAVVEAVEAVLNDTEWSGWDGREVFTDRLLYIVCRAARVEGGA